MGLSLIHIFRFQTLLHAGEPHHPVCHFQLWLQNHQPDYSAIPELRAGPVSYTHLSAGRPWQRRAISRSSSFSGAARSNTASTSPASSSFFQMCIRDSLRIMRYCLKFFPQPFFKKGWKTTPKRKLLLLRYQHGLAAHVRLQNSRNGHGAVSLALIHISCRIN